MKIFCVWTLDLLSNFRTHVATISIVLILLNVVFLSNVMLTIILLMLLMVVIFPIASWSNKSNLNNVCEDNEPIFVASFNVQWNSNKHESSLKYIHQCKADILVLQEVTEEMRKVINEYQTSFPYQLGEGHSHVMILAKHKLEFVNYLSWPGKFQHRAIHAVCYLKGIKINVLAIHLQVTRTWKEIVIRDEQIETLTTTLAGVNAPALVVGDFNSGVGSTVLRKIERNTSLRSVGSLLNYLSTWPAGYGQLAIQLDHCYVNMPLAVANIKIGPRLDSDHRPIEAKIMLVNN
jgi:endonuclease/exonuclease/phosphatase (EEP) superfamily protein YafD